MLPSEGRGAETSIGNVHELWDQAYEAPQWGQSRRRLSRAPKALGQLSQLLASEPTLAECLTDILPRSELSQASLFFAGRWQEKSGQSLEVLIKLDCTPIEFFWARALGPMPEGVAPTLYASGESLGGMELRWLVMEHVPYRFIDQPKHDVRWERLSVAAARFQAAATKVTEPFAYPLDVETWRQFLAYGIRADAPPAAKSLLDRLEEDWEWLEEACPAAVNFGDLHFGNALCRSMNPTPEQVVLIDPLPRRGPWAFDPAYCQTVSATADVQMVARMAKYREGLGLPTGRPKDLERITVLLLGWLSTMWWGIVPQRHEDKTWLTQAARYIEVAGQFKPATDWRHL